MTSIQTFIVEPGAPELLERTLQALKKAISPPARTDRQELRSLELFVSDQSRGVALVAKADGEPIGTCLLVESRIEPNHDVSPWPMSHFDRCCRKSLLGGYTKIF